MAGIQRRIDNCTDEREVVSDILIDEASRVFDRELCTFLEKPLGSFDKASNIASRNYVRGTAS